MGDAALGAAAGLRMADRLIRNTMETHEYERERALRVYEMLRPELAVGRSWGGHEGYAPSDRDTDDDRIIVVFELLDGSMLGDWIFGALDFDSGVDLKTVEEED